MGPLEPTRRPFYKVLELQVMSNHCWCVRSGCLRIRRRRFSLLCTTSWSDKAETASSKNSCGIASTYRKTRPCWIRSKPFEQPICHQTHPAWIDGRVGLLGLKALFFTPDMQIFFHNIKIYTCNIEFIVCRECEYGK